MHTDQGLPRLTKAYMINGPVVGTFFFGLGQPRATLQQYIIEGIGELATHLLQLYPHSLQNGWWLFLHVVNIAKVATSGPATCWHA